MPKQLLLPYSFLPLFLLLRLVLPAQAPPCATEIPPGYQWPAFPGPVVLRETVSLPVVVHVLYYHAEENISNEQILSQIEALNRAFHDTGANRNALPAAFRDLQADVNFTFCLATLDPEGNPTTGITRTAVSQPAMGLTDAVFYAALGGVDNWDPRRYINIRVVDMGGSVLGKAGMPGEEAAKDGLLIDPHVFGTTGLAANGSPHELGFTAVHEMGHYFGLLHPWGSSAEPLSCENDDGLQDTPPSTQTYLNQCPATTVYSCGSPDMYSNYMYYTDDACMGQFTPQQKGVMWQVLLGSRKELLWGGGCASDFPTLRKVEELEPLLFPNPFSQNLYLQWPAVLSENLHLRLYDSQGNLLARYEVPIGSSSFELTLQDLPSGLYLLLFFDEKGRQHLRKKVEKIEGTR